MDGEMEIVRQARESFGHILFHRSYRDFIRDDEQRNLLMDMVDGTWH